MRHRLLPVAVAALLISLSVRAQEPPPAAPAAETPQPPITFKVEVNYVEVDAVVTDAQGNFVRNLTKDDFELVEQGKPQSVSTFALVDIPVEREVRPLFSPTAVEPDVRSNEREFNGRLYVIVLDSLHTSLERTPRVRASARRFIERYLGANDLAAVIHTGNSDYGQEFTSSRRLLLASVDRFSGRKQRSATLERIDEFNQTRNIRQPGDPVNDPSDSERGFHARNMLTSMKSIADFMAGVRGRRKALIFISEGIDYDIHDIFNASYASTLIQDTRDTIGAATRSNVNIYAIDPRGLTSGADLGIEVAELPGDTRLGLGTRTFENELQLSQDSLRVLADETGGFAAVNSNDFTQAFERIVAANSSYYLLGYYPANSRRDGRFRKIEVRVKRPGLTVRARKGYQAPSGRAPETPTSVATGKGLSAPLRAAIDSPMPVTGLGLEVFAAPFKAGTGRGALLITTEVRGSDLTFEQKDGLFVDNVELTATAFDHTGKVQGGDNQVVSLKLKPETHEAVSKGAIRVMQRLEIPVGRYQLRVAARESNGGRVGSVNYDVEVPDYSKSSLTISGVLVTSATARMIPTITATSDESLKQVLPAPPMTSREFQRDDELALFAEVYDNENKAPHKVDIKTVVLTDEGKVVFNTEETRDSSELAGARGAYGHAARIPLQDLAPGLYVVRVEAVSRLNSDEPIMRQVQIRIVGS